MAKGYRRFLAGFDLHGDQQDSATVNAFLRFSREFKPNDRVLGGDVWDMRPLRAKASADEKRESLLADFDAGQEFVEQFRPTAITLGNHCQRLYDAAGRTDGPISDLAGELVARFEATTGRLGSRILPYDKRDGVLSLGALNLLHGFFTGMNACRQHAAIYGPCLFGHIHAFDHCVLPSHGRARREAWSVPCLAKYDMPYNATTPSTLRYSAGWAYGVYSDTDYEVCIAQVRDGKAIVSTDLKVVSA